MSRAIRWKYAWGVSIVAAVFAGSTLAGTAGAGGRAAVRSHGLAKVTVAVGVGVEDADILVAIQNGYFKSRGIDAQLQTFPNGNSGLDEILTGQADIGDTTEAGGLIRRSKGGAIYVVGMGPRSGTANALAGEAATITQPTDLYGKTVGFPVGTSANYFFNNYVKHYNLDPSKIKLVNAQPPDLLAALNRGDIDAMFIWDPWPQQAAASIPGVKILQYSGKDGVFFAQQYYYFGDRLVGEPKLAIAALRAIIQGNTFIKQHPNKAANIVSGVLHLDPTLALGLLKQWSWGQVSFTPQAVTNELGASKFLVGANLIPFTPNLNVFLHPEFLRAINPALATFKTKK